MAEDNLSSAILVALLLFFSGNHLIIPGPILPPIRKAMLNIL